MDRFLRESSHENTVFIAKHKTAPPPPLPEANDNVDYEGGDKKDVKEISDLVRGHIKFLFFLGRSIRDQALTIQPEGLVVKRLGTVLALIRAYVHIYNNNIYNIECNESNDTQKDEVISDQGKVFRQHVYYFTLKAIDTTLSNNIKLLLQYYAIDNYKIYSLTIIKK